METINSIQKIESEMQNFLKKFQEIILLVNESENLIINNDYF